jgi:hypothetical protein
LSFPLVGNLSYPIFGKEVTGRFYGEKGEDERRIPDKPE